MPYIAHPDGFVAVVCPLCGAVVPDEPDTPQAFLGGEAIGPVCFDHPVEFTPAGWAFVLDELEVQE